MIEQFISFMRERECGPASASDIVADDVMRDIDAEGERRGSKKIRYVLTSTPSGAAFGGFVKYNGQNEWHSYRSWPGKETNLPHSDQAFITERRQARKEEIERGWEDTSLVAAEHLRGLPRPSDDHPYLRSKEIRCMGDVRLSAEGDLLLPTMQGSKIWSYQRILASGDKYFLTGGRTGGCYLPLFTPDDDQSEVVVVEGYATGVSVREATGLPVYVAFNAGNLPPVCAYIRDLIPGARIIIAADNDAFTFIAKHRPDPDPKYTLPASDSQWHAWREQGIMHNPGIDLANKAAALIGGAHVIWPSFDDGDHDIMGRKLTDFNDLMSYKGQEAVRQAFAAIPERETTEFQPPIEVRAVSERANASPAVDPQWMDKLIYKNRNTIHPTSLTNARLFLTNHDDWRGCFAYDEFAGEEMVIAPPVYERNPSSFRPRPINQHDINSIISHLERNELMLPGDKIMAALNLVTNDFRYNPVRDWMSDLVWDGKKRLDTWLIDICAATEQPAAYLRAIGPCFFIAGVARVFNPGCPFHHMLVLEGGQGAYKSTLFRTLATVGHDRQEYFSDKINFAMIGQPHFAQHLQGNLILEFAELSSITKKGYEEVKQWITLQEDDIMKKFEKKVTTYPRQFILAGTTNETQWLRDPTGNRRFWPVHVCGKIDIARATNERDQLWAEAVVRWRAGERWFIDDSDPVYELIQAEQAARMMDDVWGDAIEDFIGTRRSVKMSDILENCLFIPKGQQDNAKKARVKGVLMTLGFEYKQTTINGMAGKYWIKKG
jgi:putative DNA primase/helicase